MRRRLVGWVLLAGAGGAFFFAVETPWQAALALVGTVLVNVGVDMAIADLREQDGP